MNNDNEIKKYTTDTVNTDVIQRIKQILCIPEIEDKTELLQLKAKWAKKFRELSINIGIVIKSKINPLYKSKYVPLDAILEVINDTIKTNSIDMCPTIGVLNMDGDDYLYIEIMDTETGFSIIRTVVKIKPVESTSTKKPHDLGTETKPVESTSTKKNHALGIELTYTKRYYLSSIFNISSDEDTDGNNSSQVQTAIAKPAASIGNKNYYDKKTIEEFISFQEVISTFSDNWQNTYKTLMIDVEKVNSMTNKFVDEQLATRLIKAIALIKQEVEKKKNAL